MSLPVMSYKKEGTTSWCHKRAAASPLAVLNQGNHGFHTVHGRTPSLQMGMAKQNIQLHTNRNKNWDRRL